VDPPVDPPLALPLLPPLEALVPPALPSAAATLVFASSSLEARSWLLLVSLARSSFDFSRNVVLPFISYAPAAHKNLCDVTFVSLSLICKNTH
jgi:hypothetical protein